MFNTRFACGSAEADKAHHALPLEGAPGVQTRGESNDDALRKRYWYADKLRLDYNNRIMYHGTHTKHLFTIWAMVWSMVWVDVCALVSAEV